MCQFLSALALKNGDVLTHPMLDSHADLVTYFQLPDDQAHHQHFAKIELRPVDWMDVATWTFVLDEETAPGWWADVSTGVEQTLRDRAAKMILRDGEHRLIVDGVWIVGGTAVIRDVRAGRIVRAQGSAQISHVGDAAQISYVGGSAQISYVGDAAQISHVGGSAQISHVWGAAQISNVWGSAQISHVGGSAQISHVWGAAQISHVGGSAQISYVGDAAILDDSAREHCVK